MRVPDRSPIAWAALAALVLGLGCASQSPIQVAYDQRADLSRFRTWDWIEGDAIFVHAPYDAAGVEARLSALVESALRERGLERAPGSAEVRVAAMLVGVRHVEAYRRARAMQTLYSNHDIGGYEVQGEEEERRTVDRCRLAILLTGPHQEQLIWKGVSEAQHANGCAPHLDEAVADLLAGFPPSSR
jgi:hypothetical protein